MLYTVKVTDEHIRLGRRTNCYKCPIALALMELFPDKTVEVGGTEGYLRDPNNGRYIKKFELPHIAQMFIYQYYKGFSGFGPIEFEVFINDSPRT
jgi:hypothetical protein